MRKIVGYIISWVLFGLGDLVSKPMNYWDWLWLYPIYNWLMLKSSDVQEWAGNQSPWKETNGI